MVLESSNKFVHVCTLKFSIMYVQVCSYFDVQRSVCSGEAYFALKYSSCLFFLFSLTAMSQEGSEGAGEAVRGPSEASGVQHGTTAPSLQNGDRIFCSQVISTRCVNAEKTSEELKTDKEHRQGNRQPLTMCAASMVMLAQHLSTSVLVLVNGLVMLLVGPDYPHFPEACSLLVYLDPSFAILAAIILVAGAVPQV